MKILLIEDQQDKRDKISNFIQNEIEGDFQLVDKESLRGGLKEVVTNSEYDLILLDMSMPNFDPDPGINVDSSPESFAGKELLEQMRLRDIKIPVIVITQFSSFEGGSITLDSLSKEFHSKYNDFYIGSVYFNSATDAWKNSLSNMLRSLL